MIWGIYIYIHIYIYPYFRKPPNVEPGWNQWADINGLVFMWKITGKPMVSSRFFGKPLIFDRVLMCRLGGVAVAENHLCGQNCCAKQFFPILS